jgi:hypothetical protein
MGSFDELFRFDLTRGTIEVHSFSGWAIGEAGGGRPSAA